MAISMKSLNANDVADWFEGVIFQNTMTDNKLGAYCKNEEFCVAVGASKFKNEAFNIVAIGRWDGEKYSVLNRVPLPFVVNPYLEVSGKSAVIGRNIVGRLKSYITKSEEILFQEYLAESERYGISYILS